MILELTEQEAEKLITILHEIYDCGPRGEGWQSDEWMALKEKVQFEVEGQLKKTYGYDREKCKFGLKDI